MEDKMIFTQIIEGLKNLSLEKKIEFIDIFQDIFQELEKKRNIPYKETPYSLSDTNILPRIKKGDLTRLRLDDKFTEIPATLEGEFSVENNIVIFTSPYFSEKFYCYSLKTNEILRKYENKNILIQTEIRYTPSIAEFTLHNIKVYIHINPVETWTKIQKGASLFKRYSNIAEYLGINSEELLPYELFVLIYRLVPLVQKHYLYVELAPRGIGKTALYEKLQYSLQNTAITRANMFIDGRNNKEGNFLNCNNCIIIDEFPKVQNSEIYDTLQVYHSGDKNSGTITINTKKRVLDISTVLLGNVPNKIDYVKIFSNKINIFEGTAIISDRDKTGDAFISRIDGLVTSSGCRKFSSNMLLEDTSSYYPTFLRSLCDELREKTVDIKELLIKLNIEDCQNNDSRSQNAIEKTFEGLIKLLYPELISNLSIKGIEEDIHFLYERALEVRRTVNNMLEIIKPERREENFLSSLDSQLRRRILNIHEYHICTPHRVLIFAGNTIIKKPLDTIGILQNENENEILEKLRVPVTYYTNGELRHGSDITFNIVKRYISEDGKTDIKSYDWEMPLDYNYIAGECEYISDEDYENIEDYSFYDVEIK